MVNFDIVPMRSTIAKYGSNNPEISNEIRARQPTLADTSDRISTAYIPAATGAVGIGRKWGWP